MANDGVKSFADLCLFVHLHVQAIGHLVILEEKYFEFETRKMNL